MSGPDLRKGSAHTIKTITHFSHIIIITQLQQAKQTHTHTLEHTHTQAGSHTHTHTLT